MYASAALYCSLLFIIVHVLIPPFNYLNTDTYLAMLLHLLPWTPILFDSGFLKDVDSYLKSWKFSTGHSFAKSFSISNKKARRKYKQWG